jgi:hypothetical protein
MVGSGPNNCALSEYSIASGYAVGLGLGDPVKLTTDGTIIRASNDTADSIGVFAGVNYTDSDGKPQFKKNWTASTTATNIKALVDDQPMRTFVGVGDGPIPLVQRGDIFAMNLTDPDTATGRSTMSIKVLAEIDGAEDISAITDLGAEITALSDTDTFTIRTSAVTAGDATTITIADGDGATELLVKLNAVDNISAEVDATTGFLSLTATDGYDMVLVDGTGTPLADSDVFPAAGTITEVVAASAGLVKVINVVDVDTYALEVVLVDHDLRDDG